MSTFYRYAVFYTKKDEDLELNQDRKLTDVKILDVTPVGDELRWTVILAREPSRRGFIDRSLPSA